MNRGTLSETRSGKTKMNQDIAHSRRRPRASGTARLCVGTVLSVMMAVWFPGKELLAQKVPSHTLGAPIASLAQGFTRIAGIHEYQDGSILLLDTGDRLVYVVSADLATATQVGRHGAGPGEYTQPLRILTLGGDSIGVYDGPNGRLLVVKAHGETSGIIDLRYGAPSPALQLGGNRRIPSQADTLGRFYAQTPPFSSSGRGQVRAPDSMAIQRWSAIGRRDTAAFVLVDDATRQRQIAGSPALRPLGPFSAVSRWCVSPDGVVAVVYPTPYRVVIYSDEAGRAEGEALPNERIRVTEQHKEAYREEMTKPRKMLMGSVANPGSGAVGRARLPFNEPAEWPEFLPPYPNDAGIGFSGRGNLWIERSLASANALPVYDIVDRAGTRIGTVQLPIGRRLAGFGSNVVYLVRRDDVDLEYLERYPWPPR